MEPMTGEVVDEVLVTVMRAPRTYTREDIVEIHGHGGPVLLHRILGLLIEQGVRLAEPGEFTKRAFLSGRIDLTQAEAVMDLIQAKTRASGRAALTRLQGALGREIQDLRDRLSFLLAYIEAAIDFRKRTWSRFHPPEPDVGGGVWLMSSDSSTRRKKAVSCGMGWPRLLSDDRMSENQAS